ncbi:hypothetical protein [Sedimentitalea nanhaiensis]|uniref:hypothetical protein n=1 Tax=Sedimentitalea nanhaiensis TaxID=999627 RepID=UPI00040044A2|nr:hypothetical protein [Sedimentitalea nanhaiensis]
MTKRHSFSDKFNATVALAALRGDKPAIPIERRNDMNVQKTVGHGTALGTSHLGA